MFMNVESVLYNNNLSDYFILDVHLHSETSSVLVQNKCRKCTKKSLSCTMLPVSAQHLQILVLVHKKKTFSALNEYPTAVKYPCPCKASNSSFNVFSAKWGAEPTPFCDVVPPHGINIQVMVRTFFLVELYIVLVCSYCLTCSRLLSETCFPLHLHKQKN